MLETNLVCHVFGCTEYGHTVDTTHKHNTQGSAAKISYRIPLNVRYDLIPPIALEQLAQVYEEGAQNYGEAKYIEKPLLYSVIVNHAFNHLMKFCSGDRSELHAAKVMWAMATLITLEQLAADGLIESMCDISQYGSRAQEALQKRKDSAQSSK